MKVAGWIVAMACSTSIGGIYGQEACFRSVGEAAVQSGVRDVEGFRLERVSRDVLGSRSWATVRSCVHPERPGVLVAVAGESVQVHLDRGNAATETAHPKSLRVVVMAGAKVTVVAVEAMVRMQASGVAQEPGALGDAVKVRLLGDGEQRFVTAVVRSAELLEIVR